MFSTVVDTIYYFSNEPGGIPPERPFELSEGQHPNEAPNGHHQRFEKPEKPHFNIHPFRGLSFFLVVTIVSLGVKAATYWFESEKVKSNLENAKLKAEIAALKAQINPHFFFNVMNNLASLARKKSDDTEKYIIKISEILRYNLNDLSLDKVCIDKEIEFINNYIDIQKMRINPGHNISFYIDNESSEFEIEPMLLYPFIENAFKHGNIGDPDFMLDIKLNINTKDLSFIVVNSYSVNHNAEQRNGIGQENISRRLQLLYPDKHELMIEKTENEYIVELKLQTS